MMPKLKADNFENMELIRPLFYVDEVYIERFTQNAGIWPLNCACMVAAKKVGNKRYEIKALIKELKKNFDDVDKSIFRAATNVNMDAILGWKQGDNKYSFLDFYDKE
jgi:tRNA(Ile)-lysidine synthase TilS/MesJ